MILHEALVFETNYNCPSPVIIIITIQFNLKQAINSWNLKHLV